MAEPIVDQPQSPVTANIDESTKNAGITTADSTRCMMHNTEETQCDDRLLFEEPVNVRAEDATLVMVEDTSEASLKSIDLANLASLADRITEQDDTEQTSFKHIKSPLSDGSTLAEDDEKNPQEILSSTSEFTDVATDDRGSRNLRELSFRAEMFLHLDRFGFSSQDDFRVSLSVNSKDAGTSYEFPLAYFS